MKTHHDIEPAAERVVLTASFVGAPTVKDGVASVRVQFTERDSRKPVCEMRDWSFPADWLTDPVRMATELEGMIRCLRHGSMASCYEGFCAHA